MKSLVFYVPPRPPLLVLFLSCFLWTTTPVLSRRAWQACSNSESGGAVAGICPTGATCCATSTPGVATCISGKIKEELSLGGGGSCCLDDDDDDTNSVLGSNNGTFATTGCGAGFQCAIANSSSSSSSRSSGGGTSSYRYCKRTDDEDDENPPRLPRYRLCSLPDKARELHGFPVAPYVTNATEQQQEAPPLLFAYYSNMGPIDAGTDDDALFVSNTFATVKKVIIVIHGSGRNADDYLCCMNAALPPVLGRTHNDADPSNSTILVIAPWFVAEADLPVNITIGATSATGEPLVWNQYGPIEHTWYGHYCYFVPLCFAESPFYIFCWDEPHLFLRLAQLNKTHSQEVWC
jgi:hypothetical protein